ncbi:MAG: hypothetical protein Q7S76_01940, partial [bacterium]|nr:hypothetical protein [bacterium]
FGAIASALVFTYSGTMVTYTNNAPMIQVAALLPWVMWSLVRFLKRRTMRSYISLIFLLAFQIISGHPQLTFYTWILLYGYVFFVHEGALTRNVTIILLVSLGSFVLASMQILPFLELVSHSTRARSFSFASFGSLHPFSLFRLFVPSITGSLRGGTDWIAGGSVHGYVGVLPWILVFFAPRNTRVARYFLGVLVISLLLVMGSNTPLFWIAYELVPGIGRFRVPAHFFLLSTLSLSVLSGYGIQALCNKNLAPGTLKRTSAYLGGAALIAYMAVWTVSQDVGKIIFIPFLPERLQQKIVALSVSPGLFDQIMDDLRTNFLFLAVFLAGIAYVFGSRRLSKKTAVGVLVGCIFVELFFYSSRGLLTMTAAFAERILRKSQSTAELFHQIDPITEHIMVDPALYSLPPTMTLEGQGPRQFRDAMWQAEILRPNLNMIYHIPSVEGYASLILSEYQEYFGLKPQDPTGVTLPAFPSDQLNRLGVKYLLGKNNNQESSLRLIGRDYRKAFYENLGADASPVEVNEESELTFRSTPLSVLIGLGISIAGVLLSAMLSLRNRGQTLIIPKV